MSKIKVTNHFWITGDVFVLLPGGPTQEVFRLTNTVEDATTFGRATAEGVKTLMARRLKDVLVYQGQSPNTNFTVDPSTKQKGLWVVHGIQEVEVDPEG